MKQKTGVFAVLTAVLFLGGTMAVGCGGRFAPAGSEGAGGSGGSGGTSGAAGNDGTGGSTGGAGGTGGSTGGSGGSTGGAGGSTSGVGGTGGSTGGVGGSGGSTGGVGGTGGSTGGTGGGAGKGGGTAGSGGTAPPGTIMCGTAICGPIAGTPVGTLQPCCPPDMLNTCGAVSPLGGCFTTTKGVPDPRCPSVTVMSFPLPGCCRPNGMCGVDLQVINLGCNDPVLVGGAPASRCGADNGQGPAYTGTSETLAE